MIAVVTFLLFFVHFSENAVYVGNIHELHNDVNNLKFTKLLNAKLENRPDPWKTDINSLIQPENEENNIGKTDNYVEIPIKFSFAVDKEKDRNDGNKNFILNMFRGCDALVGTSKIQLCRLDKAQESLDIKKTYPRSCREILESGINKSGIYEIKPRTSSKPFSVLCDMETKGGGWTHIQKRFDGSQDFYLGWRDYKFGFGDLNGEFWMGLENIYHMTAFETNELLIELTDRDKKNAYAQYTSFSIGPEKDGYPLNVLKGFSGDAGDALTPHLNAKFTTHDVDQDTNPGNCAQMYNGAWWYTSCHASNLNGKYMNIALSDAYKHHGLNWSGFRGHEYNLAGSRILIRPIGA
ncbi:microfibril-associated glycoprotein 4 isoform X2 [Diabrotica virgifera virgifera]|uniref:Microfibril-associated glycoprotein 4-like isoform X2 n=1 Tax=Diabrotica virgifera virgifera TaxID=50390 RepID=A0A6P7G804_DIAVI|nr:microfibril-associated glycoprotein 4 isoform X2 [Diabrotica virgifera virgifera]